MTFPTNSHRISTADASRFIFGGKAEFTIDRRREGLGHESLTVSTKFEKGWVNGKLVDLKSKPEVAFVKDCTGTFIGHITWKQGWPEFIPAGRKHFSEWTTAERRRRNVRAGLIKWVVQVIAHFKMMEARRRSDSDLARLSAGIDQSAVEFLADDTPDFVHHGKCSICRRSLSDPESIGRGIGPVCIEKLQTEFA